MNPSCPPTDFTTPPWNEAVLVTPRHSVRQHWNAAMAQATCRRRESQLLICTAYDISQGRPLTLSERFAVATKTNGRQRGKRDEMAALPNRVELAIGMSMMVTFNVETDLDIANGSCGEITKIVLDERETGFTLTALIVELAYPPAYILVKMKRTKAVRLAGGKGQKSRKRRQLPITPAYSFTDVGSHLSVCTSRYPEVVAEATLDCCETSTRIF
ncbi:hypothetical protein K503DRAFT_777026 [Rhizopogon vinicolor AM-OR11-026]|uniref:Uncharacterized protein n=1 Tax=Rhizopogon vinicolor AM-OR11-026 TaxID=1314800 RepID=A0A1B7MHJ4_9AGAM|nr:hypothetical protein K503DRAFT_777026 [Rhizopogon vinicolor AM-OR11-026]